MTIDIAKFLLVEKSSWINSQRSQAQGKNSVYWIETTAVDEAESCGHWQSYA